MGGGGSITYGHVPEGGAGWVFRDVGTLYRQLLGYAAAVVVLVGGALVEAGVGDGSS